MGGCRAWLAVALILVAGSATAQQSLRDCPTCPEMVAIPPGSFTMGVPAGEHEREGEPGIVRSWPADPQHSETISYAFWLGRYEVTRAQFAAFVEATGHVTGTSCFTLGTDGKWGDTPGRDWRNPGFTQTANDPVVCVSWDDAQAYVDWLKRTTGMGYRLPLEAEWEYAARAGSTAARYWGDSRDDACLYGNVSDLTLATQYKFEKKAENFFLCSDGYAHTAPVGQFRPNAFGLYDMLGNVWEWTGDCLNATFIGPPAIGVPGDCSLRGARGGSWRSPPMFVRAGRRVWDPAELRTSILGFRVARTN